MNRILFAADLHEPESMTRALETLAQQLGADLYALHVMPPSETVPFGGYEGLIGLEGLSYGVYDPRIAEAREQAETHAFNRFLQERFTRPVRAALRQGDPATVILDDADAYDADLIVLGHRRHGFVERLFVGSVASAVLKETRRPLMLFPIIEA